MIPRSKDLQLQPNGYTCGPAALRHALLAYGVRASTRTLAKLAGTDSEGTDSQGLDLAANEYGYKLRLKRYQTAGTSKSALRNFLHAEVPVLVPIERWTHWAVCVYAGYRKILILDSAGPKKKDVQRWMTWRDFYTQLGVCQGPGSIHFDLYPLVPCEVSLG